MAFAVGHISVCHLNPAVSFGMRAGGQFKGSELFGYIVAQLLGASVGALVLFIIAIGKAGLDLSAGFSANGYGSHSPGGDALGAALACELVMTFIFQLILIGAVP